MRDMGDPAQSIGGRGARGAALAVRTGDNVIAQLVPLLSALTPSSYRRRLGLLAAGIVLVICANSVGQIWLNA